MNETLVTPLSLSQLLKEKGVKQESTWYWIERWMPHQTESWLLDLQPHGHWYSAFSIGELPDVFRQVFGQGTKHNGMHFITPRDMEEWGRFAHQYFKDPKTAWENLERTIKSL